MAAAELTTLQLYRHILRAARHFPSVKKGRIIQNIKNEFRENKGLVDPAEVARRRAVAERGLSDLQAYRDMASTASTGSMSITLKGATS